MYCSCACQFSKLSMHVHIIYVHGIVSILHAVPLGNECNATHQCQQLCALVNGQIECECEIGFFIAHDGISCPSKYIIRMFG